MSINSLVFPGGSSKAFVTSQVACELERRVQEISGKSLCDVATLCTGSSGGAFPAAAIATGTKLDDLLHMFRPDFDHCAQITSREGLSWFVPVEEYWPLYRPRVSLLVDPLFPEGASRAAQTAFDPKLTFTDCKCQLQIAASTVDENRPVVIKGGEVWKAVAASSAFKRVFSPIDVPLNHLQNNERVCDGVVKLYDASYSGQYFPGLAAARRAKELQKEGDKIVSIYFDHTPGINPGVSLLEHYSTLTWLYRSEIHRREEEKAEVMDQSHVLLGEDTAYIHHLQVPYQAAGISPIDFSLDTILLLKKAVDDYILDNGDRLDAAAHALLGS